MDKYFRYLYYILTISVVVFAVFYIWVFLTQGDFARADIKIANQEPFSVHLVISASSSRGTKKIFRGSIEAGKTKLIEQFTYGAGTFDIKLNKQYEFSIGDFSDKVDFSKTLIIKDNKAYFKTQ